VNSVAVFRQNPPFRFPFPTDFSVQELAVRGSEATRAKTLIKNIKMFLFSNFFRLLPQARE